jgi:hypothetical protein
LRLAPISHLPSPASSTLTVSLDGERAAKVNTRRSRKLNFPHFYTLGTAISRLPSLPDQSLRSTGWSIQSLDILLESQPRTTGFSPTRNSTFTSYPTTHYINTADFSKLCGYTISFGTRSFPPQSALSHSMSIELGREEPAQHQGLRRKWRSFFGRDSAATDAPAGQLEEDRGLPSKWSMGILNDRTTHEVPGWCHAHPQLLLTQDAYVQSQGPFCS